MNIAEAVIGTFHANVGRPRIVKTPKELGELFEKYVAEMKERTICKKKQVTGTVGESSIDKTEIEEVPYPITKEGFTNWLGVHPHYLDELPEEFSDIKSRVCAYCRDVNMAGAKAGLFNPSIVARQFGLVEKKEVEQNVKAEFTDCETKEQAKQMLRRINKE